MVGELQVGWDIRADGVVCDSSEDWPPGMCELGAIQLPLPLWEGNAVALTDPDTVNADCL
jgi:hypothetical protein